MVKKCFSQHYYRVYLTRAASCSLQMRPIEWTCNALHRCGILSHSSSKAVWSWIRFCAMFSCLYIYLNITYILIVVESDGEGVWQWLEDKTNQLWR